MDSVTPYFFSLHPPPPSLLHSFYLLPLFATSSLPSPFPPSPPPSPLPLSFLPYGHDERLDGVSDRLGVGGKQLPGRWVFGVHGQTLGRQQQAAGGLDHIAASLVCVVGEGRGEGEGREGEGGVGLAKTLVWLVPTNWPHATPNLNDGCLSESCLGTDLGWCGGKLRGGGEGGEGLHRFH